MFLRLGIVLWVRFPCSLVFLSSSQWLLFSRTFSPRTPLGLIPFLRSGVLWCFVGYLPCSSFSGLTDSLQASVHLSLVLRCEEQNTRKLHQPVRKCGRRRGKRRCSLSKRAFCGVLERRGEVVEDSLSRRGPQFPSLPPSYCLLQHKWNDQKTQISKGQFVITVIVVNCAKVMVWGVSGLLVLAEPFVYLFRFSELSGHLCNLGWWSYEILRYCVVGYTGAYFKIIRSGIIWWLGYLVRFICRVGLFLCQKASSMAVICGAFWQKWALSCPHFVREVPSLSTWEDSAAAIRFCFSFAIFVQQQA